MRIPCIVQQQVKIKNNLHLQQQLYLQNYFLKQNNKKIKHLVSKTSVKKEDHNQYNVIANMILNLEDKNRMIMNEKKKIFEKNEWYWDEDFENM